MDGFNKKFVRKGLVNNISHKIQEQIVNLTFDEIIELVPKILEYFTDEQVAIILSEVEKNRIEKDPLTQ